MKKQFLLFASFAIAAASFAQDKPSFGIRAGVTSASMSGDAVNSLNNLIDYTNGMITTGNRKGFFAGGFASIPLSQQISIEPGVYYSQKGYSLNGALNMKGVEILNVNAKAQLQSQYIDLPVLLKANVSGFEIFAGPQVSYLTKADLRTTAGILGFNLLNKKMDATEQMNRWDAAVTGGVGYQFKNGFSINAAYDYGLSKADANKNMETYNRAFKIGAGFKF
jgi:hypothetical protein